MRSITSNQVSGAALIDAAEHGETVVVTRDGVPIGEFIPRPATAAKPRAVAERLAEFERKYPPDPEFADLLEEIHRELNESGRWGTRVAMSRTVILDTSILIASRRGGSSSLCK